LPSPAQLSVALSPDLKIGKSFFEAATALTESLASKAMASTASVVQFITCTLMSAQAWPAPRPPATSVKAASAHPRERLSTPFCRFGFEYIELLLSSPPAVRRDGKKSIFARGSRRAVLKRM
jgi:hypothetical protein